MSVATTPNVRDTLRLGTDAVRKMRSDAFIILCVVIPVLLCSFFTELKFAPRVNILIALCFLLVATEFNAVRRRVAGGVNETRCFAIRLRCVSGPNFGGQRRRVYGSHIGVPPAPIGFFLAGRQSCRAASFQRAFAFSVNKSELAANFRNVGICVLELVIHRSVWVELECEIESVKFCRSV